MCPDGPGSSGQTGHADNGGQYMHFKWISGKKPERIDNGIMHFKLASVDEGGRIVCAHCQLSVRSSLRAVVRGTWIRCIRTYTDTGVKLVIEASLIVYVSITMLRLIVRRRKCESSSNHAIKDPQCVVIDLI